MLRLNNSKVEEFVTSTAYSELEKSLARRTYEESGDYVIDTFTITPRENLDDGFNNGVYRPGETTDDNNLSSDDLVSFEISPGRAYVKGYRTEFLVPEFVDAPNLEILSVSKMVSYHSVLVNSLKCMTFMDGLT